MRKEQWLVVVLMLGIAAALLGQPTPVDAGRPFGTPITIRNEEPAEGQPAVAYNSQWQEYLVVFWNDRPGCDDIRAERVATDGRLLGGVWVAAGCPAERRYPDVAYNSKDNQYLIVWEEVSGNRNYVRSQRFSADLTPQPEGVQTLYADYSIIGVCGYPAVAHAYTSNKYLVVWEYTDIFVGATSIFGGMVAANGQPVPPIGGLIISQDPGGQWRWNPDLAYNRHANGFLVVWQQYDGTSDWDIYGQLVNGDGSILPGFPPIQVAWYIQSSMTPAVAAIPTAPGAYKYLVVWWEIDVGAGNWDIYGKLVEENGTPQPSAFPIANDPAAESSPAVAGTEYGHQYLVTWRSARGTDDAPIQGRTIAYDGILLDDPSELPSHDAHDPAVAAGPDGEFLLAWQDQPPTALNKGVYGQLWGNRVYVYLPLTLRNK